MTVQSKQNAISVVQELKKRLEEKEAQAEVLRQELADLIQKKIENENSLIEKFSLLLNEKKLKIRDQQRVLSTAATDPTRLAAVQQSREGQSHSPGSSRAGKRKALKESSDQESDGGFEQMDIDEQVREDSHEEPVQTPDPQSTADEASEDEERPPPTPPVKGTVKRTVNQAQSEGTAAKFSSSTSQTIRNSIPPTQICYMGRKRPSHYHPKLLLRQRGQRQNRTMMTNYDNRIT